MINRRGSPIAAWQGCETQHPAQLTNERPARQTLRHARRISRTAPHHAAAGANHRPYLPSRLPAPSQPDPEVFCSRLPRRRSEARVPPSLLGSRRHLPLPTARARGNDVERAADSQGTRTSSYQRREKISIATHIAQRNLSPAADWRTTPVARRYPLPPFAAGRRGGAGRVPTVGRSLLLLACDLPARMPPYPFAHAAERTA